MITDMQKTDQLLKEKLLSLGGKGVLIGLDKEEEQERMLNDGRIYDEPVSQNGGNPNKCHRNVADTYRKSSKKGFKIVTGYAIGKDNVWYQHSWGFNNNQVIETTGHKYKMYFGYELTDEESDEFCFYNY